MKLMRFGYDENGHHHYADDPRVVVIKTYDDEFIVDGINYLRLVDGRLLDYSIPTITIKSGENSSEAYDSYNPLYTSDYDDLEDTSYLPSPA